MRKKIGNGLTMPLFVSAGLLLGGITSALATEVTVYKTEYCGCCDGWVDHAKQAGFEVTAKNVEHAELFQLKEETGLDAGLASCHTTFVDGYLIEGHVPADAIARLLEEQPDVIGLTAPGMPQNSPGMIEGDTFSGFDVLAVDRRGDTTVFARYE